MVKKLTNQRNRQDVEATQMSIKGGMTTEKVITTYKGILFSLEKEGKPGIKHPMGVRGNPMNEP